MIADETHPRYWTPEERERVLSAMDHNPEVWTTTPEGIPVLDIEATIRAEVTPREIASGLFDGPYPWEQPFDPDGEAARIKALIVKLDRAIDRDDRVAVANIESILGFDYADRFMREG